MDKWHQVIREVHLLGGGRAINNLEPVVDILPSTVDGKGVRISLAKFGDLYRDLESLGFKVVGCDFYTSSFEVEGINPPQWRTKCAGSELWLCTEQGDVWSFIAHSAFREKKAELCDVSSRISHQLRACEWRLRQLSESYNNQLVSRLKDEKFEEGGRFSNGYTVLCYLAVQSYLVEACILRDYLAEFYWLVMSAEENIEKNKITTLGGLYKFWSKKPPMDSAGMEMKACATKGNWLYELGAYRDLVVHSAPLAHADRTLFAVCQNLALPQGKRFPLIKLPLPNNPSGIAGERSSGAYYQDPELNFARFSNALENFESAKDALGYAHLTMQLLGALAKSVSKLSPVTPEIPTFTTEDIIGDIKFL